MFFSKSNAFGLDSALRELADTTYEFSIFARIYAKWNATKNSCKENQHQTPDPSHLTTHFPSNTSCYLMAIWAGYIS